MSYQAGEILLDEIERASSHYGDLLRAAPLQQRLEERACRGISAALRQTSPWELDIYKDFVDERGIAAGALFTSDAGLVPGEPRASIKHEVFAKRWVHQEMATTTPSVHREERLSSGSSRSTRYLACSGIIAEPVLARGAHRKANS